MRDTLNENIRPENPVFDVQQVNKALVSVNTWIDSRIMDSKGDAMTDMESHLVHSGRPGEEHFIEYMSSLMHRMAVATGEDEDEIVELIHDVLDQLEDDGMIDPMPEVEVDPDTAFALWVGQAETLNLEALVLQYIESDEMPVDERSHLGEAVSFKSGSSGEKQYKPNVTDTDRIAALRKIAHDFQADKVEGQMVDANSARLIVQIYDSLSDKNKSGYSKMSVDKMASIAWKIAAK